MFFANTMVVSAWAKPCMMSETEMSQSADMEEVPCHEENKNETQDPLNHCDGVCLCLHVSVSQTPVLSDLISMPDIFLGTDSYVLFDENVSSQDYSPSNPPPIFIS